ncbi:regulator of hypoxia-inducible factor 1-like [Wyeomyia smithii]|uniref:regulator of hypoxia-inducible factor 1-like n=1 Tax=Wyeomyia smithii TaxID=174621 RepID=UPI002467E7E3|nr:regulator of hypoxia-inducible factor 1-like [Wyeomyia smithii]
MRPIHFVKILLLVAFFKLSFAEPDSAIIPPLFRFDSYEQQPGVFCNVAVHLKPTEKDLVKSKRLIVVFQRTYLEWGIYVKNCEHELANISRENQQQLYYPAFPIDILYIKLDSYFDDQTKQFNRKYETLMNICVNNRLKLDYNLTERSYSEIQYCLTNDSSDPQFKIDWWTIAFLLITFTLIAIVLIASMIDFSMVDNRTKDNLIVAHFAIRRNWSHLLKEPKSKLYQDFGYIDGLRFCVNIFTIFVHCLVVGAVLPLNNPEKMEMIFKAPITLIIITIGPVSVQCFFVITGMLQMANFLKDIQTKPKFEGSYFRSKVINRLIRLFPVYLFYLLFSIVADSLPGVVVSPTGYRTLVAERFICRRHGWKNLLFINNLPESTESCFRHGWYLAADQQLFLSSLILFALIWKFPNKSKFLLWVVTTASVIVPAIIGYYQELHSLIPINMPQMRTLYYYEPWFYHVYQPGYTNMNAIMVGVIAGYLYHHSRRRNINLLKSSTYKLIRRATFLTALFLVGSVPLLYEYEIPVPSLLNTIHFVLLHNCSIVAVSLCFIHCFENPAGLFRRILNSRLLTSLGKLSYSAYVLHVPLLRLILNYAPEPVEMSYSKTLLLCTGIVFGTYPLALVTYLVIEQPCSLLLKHWYQGKNSEKKK